MNEKIYFFIIIFVFLIQISFSFFYSSEMVNYNGQLNESIQTLKKSQRENQKLKLEVSRLFSIDNLIKQISTSSAQPIKNSIDISGQN